MMKHDTKRKNGNHMWNKEHHTGPTLIAKGKSGINSCTKKGGEGERRDCGGLPFLAPHVLVGSTSWKDGFWAALHSLPISKSP